MGKAMKTVSNEPKESREARRQRLENIQRARIMGRKYILPTLGALFALIVVLFFYRYGFGETRTLVKASGAPGTPDM